MEPQITITITPEMSILIRKIDHESQRLEELTHQYLVIVAAGAKFDKNQFEIAEARRTGYLQELGRLVYQSVKEENQL